MKTNIFYVVLVVLLLGQPLYGQNLEDIVQDHFTKITDSSTSSSGLSADDVAEYRITDIVNSLNPNIKHVYTQQYHEGIEIQYATYKLTVKSGNVSYEIDQFVKEKTTKIKTNNKTALISAEQAILKVAQLHDLDIPILDRGVSQRSDGTMRYAESGITADEPIEAKQIYFQDDQGKLRLSWSVSLYEKGAQNWWIATIDAASAELLEERNQVIHCSFGTAHESNHRHASLPKSKIVTAKHETAATSMMDGETYTVYPMPIESPSHGSRTVVSEPANRVASPYGWHDTNGVAGPEYTITRGNNVWAQDDSNGNNGTGFAPDGGDGLDFNFTLDLNDSPSSYISAAVTNLFYWNNIMHDVWYQYGFDESSGNFQEDNYGKGGRGSDSVFADAQDGSGTNNANFATPSDGSNPRMQMFLFTTPTRDGDLDNGIIAHEYGHGISTRLVGGPSSNVLGGSEQMGEGWSDWFGLMLTIKPGDVGSTGRGMGTFAIGQDTSGGGIRPTAYSTDTAINGTDYGDISGLAVPHGVGYGFATILWDMTWALIDQEGFDEDFYTGTGGNNIAMALVIEGLKNTANNPGYVSGRDGILQADQDLYGGAYNCLIWTVFSERGVGLDADENSNGGTNTNRDQIVSFVNGCNAPGPDEPTTCAGDIASFPYSESFEGTLGAWAQATDDDLDWTITSGSTPSNGTGPAGAADGTSYIFVEASGNGTGFPTKTTVLNSPCLDFRNLPTAKLGFQYHMLGGDIGSLAIEVRTDNEGDWSTVFSQTGAQGSDWITTIIDLDTYAGNDSVQLRFSAITGSGFAGDIALDNLQIAASLGDTPPPTTSECTGIVSSFPTVASFETNLGAWSQETAGDDIDWTRDSNGTPSSGTGPDSAADGSVYLYVEASGDGEGFPNKSAILNSPCLDFSDLGTPSLAFQYHMTGDDVGSLTVEARTDNEGDWVSIFSRSGADGTDWNVAQLDLEAYAFNSSVQLRFRVVTGNGWQGDIAIDALAITSGSVTPPPPPTDGCLDGVTAFPYGESFEGSSFPGWSNASGNDVDWALSSGATPSSGTGPDGASDGSTYVFVEASTSGTGFPNKNAVLNAPCFDLSNVAAATFSFQYHMLGDDIGSLAVEASTDNASSWVTIFTISGAQGANWNTEDIDMSLYVGGSVQLRFNVVTGTGFAGDIAIDAIAMRSGAPFAAKTAVLVSSPVIRQGNLNVLLHPNPIQHEKQLHVVLKNATADVSTYQINTIVGQTIDQGLLQTPILDVSTLESGVYLLQIQNSDSKVIKAFVVD